MTARTRQAIGMLAALLLGAVGYLLLGGGPDSATLREDVEVDWEIPVAPSGELSAADEVWNLRAPWGERPANVDAGDAEPAPPPPRLVGVVAEAGAFHAVFIIEGAGETRVKAGDRLPGGGRVIAVSRFQVTWTDGQGTRHEQELLADPLPPAATDGSP